MLSKIENLFERWQYQLLFIFVPIAIIFLPVFFAGRFVGDGDVINYLYPNLYFISQAINNGQSVLWNPLILSGFSSYASLGEYYSVGVYLLSRFFNYILVYNILLLINLTMAGFFAVRFIKLFKVSGVAALVGAYAYLISIATVDLPLVRAYALLPLILYLLSLAYLKRNKWFVILLGLVIGQLWLTVHYNWLLILLAFSFVYAFFMPYLFGFTFFKSYKKILTVFAIANIIGVIIGLLRLLPLLAFIPLTARSAGLAFAGASEGALYPLDFLSLAYPNINFPMFNSYSYLYFGFLPLLLVLSGLFIKDRIINFFLWVFGLCLLISIKFSPLFWLLSKMPGFKFMRVPTRWMFVGLFAASVVASLAVDRLPKIKIKDVWFKIILWLAGLAVLLSLIWTFVFYVFGDRLVAYVKRYFTINLYNKTTGLPPEHYYKVIDEMFNQLAGVFSLTNYRLIVSLVMIASGAFVFYLIKNKKINEFVILAVCLTALNLMLVYPVFFMTMKKNELDYQSKIAQFVSATGGRTLSFMPGYSEYQKLIVPFNPSRQDVQQFQAEMMTPQVNVFYRVRSANGFDSLMPAKYAEVIALLGSDRAVAGDKLSDAGLSLEEKIKLFKERHHLLDMLSVKYVISTYDLSDENLEKVFETYATKYEVPVYVFENKETLADLYLVKSVDYLSQSKNNLKAIDEKNNYLTKTLINCDDCPSSFSRGKLQVIEYKNGYLKVKADMEKDGWLVFNEQNLPGWQAYIDGQKAEIKTANYLFQALLVPEGEHEIIFKYSFWQTIKSALKI